MQSELAPCPFCGAKDAIPASPSLGAPRWRVICDDCGAEGPPRGTKQAFDLEADAEAIEAWNRRAAIEAMPVADKVEMKVLLPPAADCDEDFLDGWIAGQQYLILNHGDEQAFNKAITQDEQITALSAQVAKLREVLEWYQENVAGCRKLGSIGDPFRHALDADGGKLARAILTSQEQTDG